MFGTILTVHFVHLLPLGGQLDPNNIKGININFVCSNCIEVFKVWQYVCVVTKTLN